MSSNYKILSHTADIAAEIVADSLEELFREAFNFWLNSVAEIKIFDFEDEIEINLKADSLEQLLVDFLNEVNFLLIVKNILCVEIKNLKIDTEKKLLHTSLNVQNLKDISLLKEEIKSVTYHQMEIRNEGGKYHVKVVFDI